MLVEEIMEEGNAIIAEYLDENTDKRYNHQYDTDWNMLMRVVEKINATHKIVPGLHPEGIPERDLLYTLTHLLFGDHMKNKTLWGGYTTKRPILLMTRENVWLRCVEYIKRNKV